MQSLCCWYPAVMVLLLRLLASVVLVLQLPLSVQALHSTTPRRTPPPPPPRGCRFVLLGGTGQIGTAVASHLLQRAPPQSEIVLVGRRRVHEAVQQVLATPRPRPATAAAAGHARLGVQLE